LQALVVARAIEKDRAAQPAVQPAHISPKQLLALAQEANLGLDKVIEVFRMAAPVQPVQEPSEATGEMIFHGIEAFNRKTHRIYGTGNTRKLTIEDRMAAAYRAMKLTAPPAAQAPAREDWGPGPHEYHSLPAPIPLADGVLKITMHLDGLEVSRLLSLDVICTSNAPEVERHSRQAWLDLQKAHHGITEKGQP
jgi:hypothetical protein